MSDPTLTIRENIVEALVAKFTAQQAALPADDPYGFAWDQVLRSPIKDWAYQKARTVAVFDMHEDKKTYAFTKDCTLRVALECAFVINGDQNPSKEWNALLGAIIRKYSEDFTLGGLCIDITEVGNDSQVEDENKRFVRGVVMLNIRYRHSIHDPRKIA
jgi:hypothetical protein